jgi:presenilin-like A22 family membrane protease
MKHTPTITVLIVLIFFLAQMMGLVALSFNTVVSQAPGGEVVVQHLDTAIGERPQMEGSFTFLYMIVTILIGTGLILLLIRMRKIRVWKILYFFAVWMTCTITLGVFIDPLMAMALCFGLALLKLYKPNPWTHNLTEILIYAGIAIIFVPLLDVVWVTVLLLAISVYDVIAVWKSKHMITMAEFQTKSHAFAGIVIGYKVKAPVKPEKAEAKGKVRTKVAAKTSLKLPEETRTKNAILGGGDIAFPLIFSGVVMDSLIRTAGMGKPMAFLAVMVIPVVVTIALFILLAKAKKDRYYPAMPFLTAGCLAGYGLMLAMNLLF